MFKILTSYVYNINYQNKPQSDTCDTKYNKCCGYGDCINGKCHCYPGWSSDSNCCSPSNSITTKGKSFMA